MNITKVGDSRHVLEKLRTVFLFLAVAALLVAGKCDGRLQVTSSEESVEPAIERVVINIPNPIPDNYMIRVSAFGWVCVNMSKVIYVQSGDEYDLVKIVDGSTFRISEKIVFGVPK